MKLSYYLAKLIKKLNISAIKQSDIHKTAKICSGSHLVDSTINRYTYIGNYCTVINTKIGSFTSIADNCIIGGAAHPLDWVSTSPVFHSGKNVLRTNFSNHNFVSTKQTIIGNDVWIGNNALIKSGITIHNGAVIGMGSVVTKNVGPYEIWAGNPAKFIRKRFNQNTIEVLEQYEWWDLDETKLNSIAKNFNNIETFLLEKY